MAVETEKKTPFDQCVAAGSLSGISGAVPAGATTLLPKDMHPRDVPAHWVSEPNAPAMRCPFQVSDFCVGSECMACRIGSYTAMPDGVGDITLIYCGLAHPNDPALSAADVAMARKQAEFVEAVTR